MKNMLCYFSLCLFCLKLSALCFVGLRDISHDGHASVVVLNEHTIVIGDLGIEMLFLPASDKKLDPFSNFAKKNSSHEILDALKYW